MDNKSFIIEIKFRGIDDWNRPVFKSVTTNNYYGSVHILFSWDDTKEKVLEYFKDHMDELEFFGNHYNCEPWGGINPNTILKIVD